MHGITTIKKISDLSYSAAFSSVPSSRKDVLWDMKLLSKKKPNILTALFSSPIYYRKISVCSPYSVLRFLTLEDGTDMLSRNVGKELPLPAA
jgi:hypothetical protein